jgi:hypothetical protein
VPALKYNYMDSDEYFVGLLVLEDILKDGDDITTTGTGVVEYLHQV